MLNLAERNNKVMCWNWEEDQSSMHQSYFTFLLWLAQKSRWSGLYKSKKSLAKRNATFIWSRLYYKFYNINPIFMSRSLQCIKSQSAKVIILDKIMQNCILNRTNHLGQFLEISCLALCFKCLPQKKKYIKNSKKLEVKEEAKENKFKGTLHCVISNYRRSIHDSTSSIMWKVLGYTHGESGYNKMSKY